MPEILIGAVAHDWFTIVSNNPDFPLFWHKQQQADNVMPKRWLKRFDGLEDRRSSGSLFVGARKEPVGYLHVAVVTSALAELMREQVCYTLDEHNAWLTRVDIQVTLPQAGFDLVALFNRLETSGKRPEIHGDRTNGRTVYIGSRKSERFARVYQKFGDNREKLLRCEFQFGGKSARSYGVSLRQGTITPQGSFRGALQQTKDEQLVTKYLAAVDGFDAQLPRVVMAETNTDKWLMDTVYPVLMRRLMAHDCPPALKRMYSWEDYDNDKSLQV